MHSPSLGWGAQKLIIYHELRIFAPLLSSGVYSNILLLLIVNYVLWIKNLCTAPLRQGAQKSIIHCE